MWSVWFVFLYWDVDKYGHAGISFLTTIYQFIKIKQNVHEVTFFDIAIMS